MSNCKCGSSICGGTHPTCGCNDISKCGCGTSKCGCTSSQGCSSIQPFYHQAPACQESHCEVTVQENYKASICTSASFVIPSAGNTVTVVFPALSGIVVGAYLWNPTYGYFKIESYDYVTSTVVLSNYGGEDDAGTTVPSCTCFVVVDQPQDTSGYSSTYPYVALDFTAPECNVPLLITVTNTNGLVVGGNIQINGGTYEVTAINSSTTITILNVSPDCIGLTPGSPVIAQDSFGNYITPIFLISSNPCANPTVATGTIVVCKDGVMQPLNAVWEGQVPMCVDATTNEVQFVTLDIPTRECTQLAVCWTIEPGVTTYVINVNDNSIFEVDDIIQVEYTGVTDWRFIVTNVNSDGHHITVEVLDVTPTAYIDIAVGSVVCVAVCCEQIDRKYEDIMASLVIARYDEETVSRVYDYDGGTTPEFELVYGTRNIVYPNGGYSGYWCTVEVENVSDTRNALVHALAVMTAQPVLIPVGTSHPIYYTLIPEYSYEVKNIGEAFTDPWTSAGGDVYAQVSPGDNKNYYGDVDNVDAGLDTLHSTYQSTHILTPGQKIKLAYRPNVTINFASNHTGDMCTVAAHYTHAVVTMDSVLP